MAWATDKELMDQMVSIYGKVPESPDEMAQAVIQRINTLPRGRPYGSEVPGNLEVIGFAWDISHQPLMNSLNNFSKELGSGWAGRVWIRYRTPPYGFGSDPFQYTLTYPGAGGFGSYGGPWVDIYSRGGAHSISLELNVYSWDYRFFDYHWEWSEEWLKAQRLINCLSGRGQRFSHRFLWNDPERAQADQKFLESFGDYVPPIESFF